MKIEYINPFVTATLELFQTMMNLELKVGKPSLDQDTGDDLDVSGVIGLGGGITGTVVLRFPAVFARRVTALYSGMEGPDLESFVIDTVGEIVNIISANAKSALTIYHILISIPDVFRGPQDVRPWPAHSPRITVPFECGPERFTLTVGFQEAAS